LREEELSFFYRLQFLEIQYVVVLLLYTIFLVRLLSFRQINALQDEHIRFFGSFDLTRLCNDLLSHAWRAQIFFIDKLINHLSWSALVQQVLNLLSGGIRSSLFYRWKETHLGFLVLGGLRNYFLDLRQYQALLS
jgi:hypothetical protein